MNQPIRLLARGLLVISCLAAAFAARAAEAPAVRAEVGAIVLVDGAGDAVCAQFEHGQAVKLLVHGIDTGVRAIGCNPQTKKFSIKLTRPQGGTDAAAVSAAWEAMLGRPWENASATFVRDLDYTLRQTDDKDQTTSVGSGTLALRIFTGGFAFVGVVLVLAVWLGLLVLGAKSGLVRDAGNAGTELKHRTYSLARVQMAWWFAIIIGTYIFLWVITGDTPTLSTQALGLMGVSGVTALSAVSVDASKGGAQATSSGNFLLDLLTDTDGITLHRFQMLAMTVILGVIFLGHVGTHLAMPDFDGNTLMLLGISSGTYVGFKLPEKHVADDAAAAPAGSAAAPAAVPDDPKAGYAAQPDGAKT